MTGWPALFGALGAVSIVFGLLSVFLLAAGAPTDITWILANFVVGIVLLAGAVVFNLETLRERLASGEGRRVGKYGTSAVVQTVVAIAIVGLLGFLSARHHVRFDWTEAKVHSLSQQSRKVLASLHQDVNVTAFYRPTEAAEAHDLLDRYSYASSRFHVQFADPNSRPDLVEQFHIPPGKLANGLVHVAIGKSAVNVTDLSEQKITNALVQLTRKSHEKVYFLSGHAEHAIEGRGAGGPSGFSRAADALRNENYDVASLLLTTKGDVPKDANAVVIPGPTRPLLPQEEQALERYLARGGSILVMIDPRAQTNLTQEVASWGVDLGDDAIIDRHQSVFGQPLAPVATAYGNHPITKGMTSSDMTIFRMARSVEPEADAKGHFSVLVRTSKSSWAEHNLALLFQKGVARKDGPDEAGPISVGVAGTPLLPKTAAEPAHKPRLVVFGDSDFASNQLIGAYNNRDLFVNSVNWLLGDVQAISIRPHEARASRLQLSESQFSEIRYLSLFVLPEAIAFLGVLAWWSRRRAPGR